MILSNDKVRFFLSAHESDAVRYAIDDMCKDIENVIGATTEYNKNFDIFIGNLDSQETRDFLNNIGLHYNDILSIEEGHKIAVTFDKCFILGNGELGTVYAVYEFCASTLGVKPFLYWTDGKYEKMKDVRINEYTSSPFSFKYRCFAISDEDELIALSPNGEKRYSHNDKFASVPSSDLIVNACRLALRLKYNLFVPMTMLNILNPHEEDVVKCVTSRGLYITQNFYEPLGVSSNTWNYYWTAKNKEQLKASYTDNPKCFETVWEEYVKKWGNYKKVVYQLGMLKTQYSTHVFNDLRRFENQDDFAKMVAKVIDLQISIVNKIVGKDETFILYNDKYLSLAIKKKYFTPSENVVLVKKLNTPALIAKKFKRTKNDCVSGYAFMGINAENGTHVVQFPDVNIPENLTVLDKVGCNKCAYLSVGNIREDIFNVYVFGKVAQHTSVAPNVIAMFCYDIYGTYAIKTVYERFVSAYIRTECLYTDSLVFKISEKILSLLKNHVRSRQVDYDDNYGVSLSVDLSAFLKGAESSMSALLQLLFDIKNVFKPEKNKDYYTYSLYNQAQILLKFYSYLSNLVRYKKFYDDKYKRLAIEDGENVKKLIEEQMTGKWSALYSRTATAVANLIKQTKEI